MANPVESGMRVNMKSLAVTCWMFRLILAIVLLSVTAMTRADPAEPWLKGVASAVVPGAGQAANGDYGEAVLHFGVFAVSVYGAIRYIRYRSQQHVFNAALLCPGDEILGPGFAHFQPRQFDHDIVGVEPGAVGVARQSLLAGGAGGEHFHVAVTGAGFAGQLRNALVYLLFLAEAHLRGDIRARHREGAGLAAAAVG